MRKPFLFISDLDNTFVNHDTESDSALLQLSHELSQHRSQYGSKIVYATGRSPILYQELRDEKNLIQPDALVTSVGTEIYLDGSDRPDGEWSAKLEEGWDRDVVLATTALFPELKPQPNTEQRAFKISFFLEQTAAEKVLPDLESALQKSKLNIKLIYSSGIDLDIVPSHSDKGQAMQFLRQKWKFAAEQTVVCGDSGNDIALFAAGSERGILVGNARKELLEWYQQHPADYRYLANNVCASGILEGLRYFGFLE